MSASTTGTRNARHEPPVAGPRGGAVRAELQLVLHALLGFVLLVNLLLPGAMLGWRLDRIDAAGQWLCTAHGPQQASGTADDDSAPSPTDRALCLTACLGAVLATAAPAAPQATGAMRVAIVAATDRPPARASVDAPPAAAFRSRAPPRG